MSHAALRRSACAALQAILPASLSLRQRSEYPIIFIEFLQHLRRSASHRDTRSPFCQVESCHRLPGGNRAVDIDDQVTLIGQWDNDCKGSDECTADIDGNLIIDIDDLIALVGLWVDC